MSCGVDCRCSSDLMLLWSWRRPAAIALIRPLAWKPPYAPGAALKKKKKGKKKNFGGHKSSVHCRVPSVKVLNGVKLKVGAVY